MEIDNKENQRGLASLYNRVELKSLFINYLYCLIAVEILILIVCFLGNLGPNKGPFPWKFYFFTAFTAPLAITFLLGVIALAFNHFIFYPKSTIWEENTSGIDSDAKQSKLFQFNLFLAHMKKVPFLLVLFVLVISTVLFYKIDTILLFILNAGEKVVTYLLIACGILMSVGLIFAVAWIVTNYKLRQKHMDYEYRYRNAVMDKLGFFVLENNTVIDKNGQMITQKPAETAVPQRHNADQENLKILPPPK